MYHVAFQGPAQAAARIANGRTETAHSARAHWLPLLLGAIAAVAVLAALFAGPHGGPFTRTMRLGSLPRAPRVILLTAQRAEVRLDLLTHNGVRSIARLRGQSPAGSS